MAKYIAFRKISLMVGIRRTKIKFLPLQSSNDKSYEKKIDKIKEITFNHNDVINHLKVINHLNVQGIFDPAEFSVHSTLQNIQTVLES